MRKLRLSDDQRQKVEEIASAHDAQESELRATIEKATLALRLLMESETLEDEQVLAQGDKLSRMRAQLERSQLEMSLAMRHVLTMEQAKTLQKLTQRNTNQREGFEPPMGPPPLGPPGL
jgi:Spy/CpxP family protein refolding chaperone